MSASAAVLRELGAVVRDFRDLTHALTWWREERQRRGLQALPLEAGSGSRSREARDTAWATYAAVTRCLAAHHPVDVEDWPLSEWRVGALAHWLASDELGRSFMAERLGWSEQVAQRFMDETASVVRRRLKARGLIG